MVFIHSDRAHGIKYDIMKKTPVMQYIIAILLYNLHVPTANASPKYIGYLKIHTCVNKH